MGLLNFLVGAAAGASFASAISGGNRGLKYSGRLPEPKINKKYLNHLKNKYILNYLDVEGIDEEFENICIASGEEYIKPKITWTGWKPSIDYGKTYDYLTSDDYFPLGMEKVLEDISITPEAREYLRKKYEKELKKQIKEYKRELGELYKKFLLDCENKGILKELRENNIKGTSFIERKYNTPHRDDYVKFLNKISDNTIWGEIAEIKKIDKEYREYYSVWSVNYDKFKVQPVLSVLFDCCYYYSEYGYPDVLDVDTVDELFKDICNECGLEFKLPKLKLDTEEPCITRSAHYSNDDIDLVLKHFSERFSIIPEEIRLYICKKFKDTITLQTRKINEELHILYNHLLPYYWDGTLKSLGKTKIEDSIYNSLIMNAKNKFDYIEILAFMCNHTIWGEIIVEMPNFYFNEDNTIEFASEWIVNDDMSEEVYDLIFECCYYWTVGKIRV